MEEIRSNEGVEFTVDLPVQTVTTGSGKVVRFDIDEFRKQTLLLGHALQEVVHLSLQSLQFLDLVFFREARQLINVDQIDLRVLRRLLQLPEQAIDGLQLLFDVKPIRN